MCLSYFLLCFLFNKIREHEGGTDSAWKQGRARGRRTGELAQTMCARVSKCKHDKIKEIKLKTKIMALKKITRQLDNVCSPKVFNSI
jgi:uncharacterized hydantoinase/oxoprolinase family protein